jgi:hypothetical protein
MLALGISAFIRVTLIMLAVPAARQHRDVD